MAWNGMSLISLAPRLKLRMLHFPRDGREVLPVVHVSELSGTANCVAMPGFTIAGRKSRANFDNAALTRKWLTCTAIRPRSASTRSAPLRERM